LRSPLKLFVVLSFALFASPLYAYRISAWVPAWDANAVPILGEHAGSLDESNPGWFAAGADGSVVVSHAEDPRLRAALTGTLLLPTIKNNASGSFDGNLMATIVNSPSLREKHAEAIAQIVAQHGYDGIDVDYERMPTTAKAGFSAFVQLLGAKLHASGKRLSVTVYAKTAEEDWSGPGAQDWAAIGAVADSVKIMSYDYHWSTSSAGAISPLAWLDQIATYAEKTIPAQKIMMALPWYGYDWLGTQGTDVTYASALAKAQTSGVTVGRDENGEATFTYGQRTVFFQDATSYRRKVDAILARHSGIGGFAHWRVGAEDPATWDIVEQLHTSGTVPAELPAKDFAINGPSQLSALAGATAAAQYGFLAINGFTGPVSVSMRAADPFGGSVAVSGTSVTVNVPATTPAGAYRFTLTMTGGGITHEQLVTLTVLVPAKDFAIDGPSELSATAGTSTSARYGFVAINGFTGPVALSMRASDGFGGTFAVSGSSVTVNVPAMTAAGSYRLALTMTGGGITHEQLVTLRVSAAKTMKRRAVR
jgi:spore germination protein